MMKISLLIAALLVTETFAEPFTAPGVVAKAKQEAEAKAAQQAKAAAILSKKPALPLLKKLGDAGAATALSEAKLLSTAEKAKLFSKLEESGAFSSAEKLLPLADKLGVLQIGEDLINTPSGDLVSRGLALVALGPIYAAAATGGFLPPELAEIPALVPGLLLTGTTAAGALLIILSSVVAPLQSPNVGGGLSPIPSKRIPLLRSLGEKRIATALAEAGLLSAAESAGVFSSLEEAGALSTAESLLPVADEFGVLQKLQSVLDTPPEDLYTTGAILLIWGPFAALVSLGPIGLAGHASGGLPDGAWNLIPATLTALPAAAGLTTIVFGIIADSLRTSDPFDFPKLAPATAGARPARAAPARAAPAPPPRRAAPAPQRSAPAPRPSAPAPRKAAPAPTRSASGGKFGRLGALPDEAPQQYAFRRTGFNPGMQGSPFIRSPRAQVPVGRGFFSETFADTMSTPAVALVGLLAGSGIALVFLRFMGAFREPTTTYVQF